MRIYTADTNSLLIEKMTSEIAKNASENLSENYVLIVPEKFSVTMERLVLEKSERKSLINLQVVTLSRLLYKLLPTNNNYLSKTMGIMATKRVIIENFDRLVCYKKTAKTMGFAENVYNTISELKNSGVSPEDYYKKNKTGTSLDIKLHDIFLLYKAYEDFIKKEDLVDACDRFTILADRIYASDYIKNSVVYILGYDSTTGAGLNVFEAIISRAKQATVACLDNTGKANSYVCPPEMLNNYLKVAENLGVKPIVRKFMNNKLSVGVHIANNAYAYPYSKQHIQNEVELFESKTVIDEISFVAQDIRRRVIEEKKRYRDFAVVCSDAQGYKNIISRIFKDYELPFFVDVQEKLSEHPLASFLESGLNVIRKNFSSDEVLLFLSNVFSGVDSASYSSFDNLVFKFAINYDEFKKPFNFKSVDEKDLVIAEKVRIELFSKLEPISKLIEKAKTASDFNFAVKEIFNKFEIELKIEGIANKLENLGLLSIKDATKQVENKIDELLLGAEKILGQTQISFDEYFAIIQAGLMSETISLIPVTVDNVFIGDISTSKFFTVKNLYIIGATDGAIPMVKDDCGMIVDRELELISSTLGKKIEPTIKTINAREKMKLINICQEFSDRLVVSYSLTGKTGEECRPSGLVRELSKIFYRVTKDRGLEVKKTADIMLGIDSDAEKVKHYSYEFSSEKVAMNRLLQYVQKMKAGKESLDSEVYNSLYSLILNKGNADNKKLLKFIVKPETKVKLKDAEGLFFKNNKTSVSQLESYFSCPFKFFASFGLRLRARDEAYLKSMDYGNVLHKIAEIYIRNIKKFELKNKLPLDARMAEYEKLINFVFNEEKLKTANNKYMLLQLKQEALRLIETLTYQYNESNFKPVGEEINFGEDRKFNGIPLSRGIRLEGKIDRVDVYKNYYRVIDYKTGKIDLTPKTTYYGLKVQLFAYLLAIGASEKLIPAGAFYLPIKNVFVDENAETNYFATYKMQGYYVNSPEVIINMDRRISPSRPKSDIVNVSVSSSKENKETNTLVATGNNGFSSEEMIALAEYTKKLCNTAIKEILEGFSEPTPMEADGRTPCEYCDYRSACGRDFNSEQAVRKQKANIKFENILLKDDTNGSK